MSRVHLYTDGACRGNPGPGGWGALMIHGNHRRELCGGEAHTTNNRMELMAVIEGLKALKRPCELVLFTDSRYVMQGITEWIANWKRRGWRTSARKPVKNQDLWEMLDQEVQRHTIDWQWVRGHAGDPGNERADELANQGVDELLDAIDGDSVCGK